MSRPTADPRRPSKAWGQHGAEHQSTAPQRRPEDALHDPIVDDAGPRSHRPIVQRRTRRAPPAFQPRELKIKRIGSGCGQR